MVFLGLHLFRPIVVLGWTIGHLLPALMLCQPENSRFWCFLEAIRFPQVLCQNALEAPRCPFPCLLACLDGVCVGFEHLFYVNQFCWKVTKTQCCLGTLSPRGPSSWPLSVTLSSSLAGILSIQGQRLKSTRPGRESEKRNLVDLKCWWISMKTQQILLWTAARQIEKQKENGQTKWDSPL